MLWRVRTTMADRPGSLAQLARACAERSVNILALEVFPGVEGVTDELVLRTPAGWRLPDVAALVESAGGTGVTTGPCNEQALVDGPTRYLDAVRRALHGVEPVHQVLARLLEADVAVGTTGPGRGHDTITVSVGGEQLTVRRSTPFTATEHARARAFVDTVADHAAAFAGEPESLGPETAGEKPVVRPVTAADVDAVAAMHERCSAETRRLAYGAPLARVDGRLARRLLVGGAGALVVHAGDKVVGLASLSGVTDGRCHLSLIVEDGWQGAGWGTLLLAAATRLAAGQGAVEVELRGPAHAPAAVAMLFSSGLRARMRLDGDELVVAVSTRGVSPLHVDQAVADMPPLPEPV